MRTNFCLIETWKKTFTKSIELFVYPQNHLYQGPVVNLFGFYKNAWVYTWMESLNEFQITPLNPISEQSIQKVRRLAKTLQTGKRMQHKSKVLFWINDMKFSIIKRRLQMNNRLELVQTLLFDFPHTAYLTSMPHLISENIWKHSKTHVQKWFKGKSKSVVNIGGSKKALNNICWLI